MRVQLSPTQRLIVALDVPSAWDAVDLAHSLSPVVTTFKVGHWLLFDSLGWRLIDYLKNTGKQVFIDAKLHDIPETVRNGVRSAARSGADFITVHAGDEDMLRAAMDGATTTSCKVLAVTALTSLGVKDSRNQFRAGLQNAMVAHCHGLIMAPADLYDPMFGYPCTDPGPHVRNVIGDDMLVVTPGIRMMDDSRDDHRRSGLPNMAIAAGADYVVVGRPIVRASDPRAAAERFVEAMAGVPLT